MFAALFPLSVTAQDESNFTKSNDIVVLGQDKSDRDAQIGDFVGGMTGAPGTDPLARLDSEKLCPQAVGLAPQYNAAIIERMRRVAGAAKINVAPQGCRYPNVLVVFANDKAAMIASLNERYRWLFLDVYGDPIEIEKVEGPAVAWHVSGQVTRDGVHLSRGASIRSVRTTLASSRLQAIARPVFLMSIVIIERRGVEGLTTTQIADYAAMRAYTDGSPTRIKKTGVPTILTVLDAPMGSETPLSMTKWDLDFLRGLYDSPADAPASLQRGSINSYIKGHIDRRNNDGK